MADPTPEQVREWAREAEEIQEYMRETGDPNAGVYPDRMLSLCSSWLRQRERIERLERALLLAKEDYEIMLVPRLNDPRCESDARHMGNLYGYGALMSQLSIEWQGHLKDGGAPDSGAFLCGPCKGTAQGTLRAINEALKEQP